MSCWKEDMTSPTELLRCDKPEVRRQKLHLSGRKPHPSGDKLRLRGAKGDLR